MCRCNDCRERDDAERRMWLAIRRGLMAVVKAIDVRYGETPARSRNDRRAA